MIFKEKIFLFSTARYYRECFINLYHIITFIGFSLARTAYILLSQRTQFTFLGRMYHVALTINLKNNKEERVGRLNIFKQMRNERV